MQDGKFPNPLPKPMYDAFLKLGLKDNMKDDDIIGCNNSYTIDCSKLKPSQSEIFFKKALGIAMHWHKDDPVNFKSTSAIPLNAVISADNHIIDGHHRWAAFMLGNPKKKFTGTQVQLTATNAIAVIRCIGDVFNKGHRNSGGTDRNIFQEAPTEKTILKMIDESGPTFKKGFKSQQFLKSSDCFKFIDYVGGMKSLLERINKIRSYTVSRFPIRKDMPVIELSKRDVQRWGGDPDPNVPVPGKLGYRKVGNQLAAMEYLLKEGSIDLYPPWSPQTIRNRNSGNRIGKKERRDQGW